MQRCTAGPCLLFPRLVAPGTAAWSPRWLLCSARAVAELPRGGRARRSGAHGAGPGLLGDALVAGGVRLLLLLQGLENRQGQGRAAVLSGPGQKRKRKASWLSREQLGTGGARWPSVKSPSQLFQAAYGWCSNESQQCCVYTGASVRCTACWAGPLNRQPNRGAAAGATPSSNLQGLDCLALHLLNAAVCALRGPWARRAA